jgi:hypothetical protein
VAPEAVDAYKQGKSVNIDFIKGEIHIDEKVFQFSPLPSKLMAIFEAKGLVNYVKKNT